VRHAQAPRQHGRLTVQPEGRGRAPLAHDLDVAPPDAVAPPRTEHLHHRFLGREPRRVALEAPPATRLAVRLLALGEDARPEARAVPRAEGALDAVDLAEIDADPGDRRAMLRGTTLRRAVLRAAVLRGSPRGARPPTRRH
jgi:hypothetical protein